MPHAKSVNFFFSTEGVRGDIGLLACADVGVPTGCRGGLDKGSYTEG